MARAKKYSGVEWIGEIPEEWQIVKVKKVFVRKKEKANQDNPIILSLARSGIKQRDISTNEGQIAESYFEYNPVKKGDLLLNPMDLISGANCNLSYIDGVISPAYINLGIIGDFSAKYFDYYFKFQYWSKAFFAHGKGVSYENRWTLNNETLMNYKIPLPSAEESNKIANFLDGKTSQIDSIVADTKRSVEEFKKYKQALITETITRGLNPDVCRKSSGIEWIGEIPEHWHCSKMKYITSLSRGQFSHRPRNDERYYDGAYPFIQTGDVAKANKFITAYSQTLNELGKSVSKEFPKGTLVMTIAANVGDVAVLGFDACFPDSVIGFVPNTGYYWNYLYYLFTAMKPSFVNTAIVSTQLNLNVERVKDMHVPITKNFEEQQQIAAFLDEKTAHIDSLIANKEKVIQELETYKKAMIYEYVTGKKEVE